MAIVDLFSKRQKRLRGEMPDVYQYENLNHNFRVQIIHIITDTIGNSWEGRTAEESYESVRRLLCREYGVFSLAGLNNPDDDLKSFFLNCKEYEKCLDYIELFFKFINNHVKKYQLEFDTIKSVRLKADKAISELNTRFKEHCIGYQFESNELIRIDSQYVHSEVVKPVLNLLSVRKEYQGANAEFLEAHEHYRHKNYKECLVSCLKSFESLMKAICDLNTWTYGSTDTANKLIQTIWNKGLIPSYLQTQFNSIRSVLESGIPTVRNKNGGHGQGTQVTNVPEHLASYCLHLTAANLLFLMNCQEDLESTSS